MNDRERLIEIIDNATVTRGIYMGKDKPVFTQEVKAIEKRHVPELADYFTSHGVTVQKHGRWKFDSDGDPCCSVCRKYAGLLRIESGNYCPNCGAKMDGEADG